jgi:hypothetical protein
MQPEQRLGVAQEQLSLLLRKAGRARSQGTLAKVEHISCVLRYRPSTDTPDVRRQQHGIEDHVAEARGLIARGERPQLLSAQENRLGFNFRGDREHT